MSKDPTVERILELDTEMETEMSHHSPVFQELKDLVLCDSPDFVTGPGSRPIDSRRLVYDGTAPQAADLMASGLHSNLSNPVDRWFDLVLDGVNEQDVDHDTKLYLEYLTDLLFSHLGNPSSGFDTAMHEVYMEIAGLGNGCLYSWFDVGMQMLRYRSFPMAHIRFRENSTGLVDTVHRRISWTVRQVKQEFGPDLPEKLGKMKDTDKVVIVHSVAPRDERDPYSLSPKNRPWTNTYVCRSTEEMLFEGGFWELPYHIGRWKKVAGETYGRGQGQTVLPEIRMANAMSRSIIMASQKLLEPALQVPDDGFLAPLVLRPNGINFRRPNAEPVEKMPGPDRIDMSDALLEQRRQAIREGFYSDLFRRSQKKERQTALEINDERMEMLGILGPFVGRLQSELLGPLVRTNYNMLARYEQVQAAPSSMQGRNISVRYTSQAAKAQATARGHGALTFVQQLVQLQPIMPTIVDHLDEAGLVNELADLTDVPRRLVADPKKVAQMRQQRAQEQQMAQMAEAAPQVAKAAKDFAQAQQAGLPI